MNINGENNNHHNIKESSELTWSINSYKNYSIKQQPIYENQESLETVLKKLNKSPTIINYKEVIELKSKLTSAYYGKSFIVQLGDCAEKFDDATEECILNKLDFYYLVNYYFKLDIKNILK